MSDTEPQLRTSYNQQEAGTNERGAKRAAVQQQVDLLAAICSQTRSTPREQASKYRVTAGLALWPGSFGAAGRTKSAAGRRKAPQASQFSAPQAGKFTRSAAISLLFSLGFRSRCSRRAAPPAVRCSQRRTAERGRKLLYRSSVLFFLFFREAGPKGIKGNGAPRPRPQSSRAFARAPTVPQRGTFRKK